MVKLILVVLVSQAAILLTSEHAHAREPLEVQEVLAAFDHEPSVRQVQQAALSYAGLQARDLDNWSTRARFSNLIPKAQAQAAWLDQHDLQSRFRETLNSNDDGDLIRGQAQNNVHDDARQRMLYSLRLSLDLGGLVYDRSEPAIAREVRSRQLHRDDLLGRVTNLYFERRERQVTQFMTPHSEWTAWLELELEIQALSAQLDALTGGWFQPRTESKTTGANR